MKLRNAGIEWVCSVGMPSNMKPIVVSVHIDPWINSDWIYTHLPAGQILCSCLCGSSFWRAPRCKVRGPRGPANFRHWMDTSAFSRSILGLPQDAPGIVTKKPSSWRMAWWVEVWVGPRPPFTVRTLPWLLRSLALRSHLAQGGGAAAEGGRHRHGGSLSGRGGEAGRERSIGSIFHPWPWILGRTPCQGLLREIRRGR